MTSPQTQLQLSPRPIWRPLNIKPGGMEAFRHYINRRYSLRLGNFAELQEWSVTHTIAFSAATFDFVGIMTSSPYESVAEGLDKMWPPPRWFPGVRMNFAENLLQPGLSLRPEGVAVTVVDEEMLKNGQQGTDYTFRQLRQLTAKWVGVLRGMGVRAGDRVATVLPNRIDCLVLLLATSALGAIFSSTSPDMGTNGIIERYSQIRPKVLVCDTVVRYNGRQLDLRNRFVEVEKRLRETVPELTHIIVANGSGWSSSRCILATEVLTSWGEKTATLQYEQVPFDHPVYILYSSGTTGAPKCITHAGGRALLMQKKELMLTGNVGRTSTAYQYTTTGWMMWNWFIASLSLGARIVLYDGSPTYPTAAHQLQLLERERVTYWGTSPKFLTVLKQQGLPKELRLETLQSTCSAGSPLSVELHEWFAANFPKDVGLFSGSGGTDLVGGIVTSNPVVDVYAGEIASASIGVKVEIYNSEGRNIDHTGEKGDLVITKPFFSMPIGFWGDDGDRKYRAAYFEQYPGVWYHGDFIRRSPITGGYEILGRSDGVLNPGGVRFGSAEIYGIIEKLSGIQDSLCVAQKLPPDFRDEQVLLFLKMLPSKKLDNKLLSTVRQAISRGLSPRHVPAHMYEVQDIPYTVNGKRLENLVRDIVAGKEVAQARTAINPECLAEYKRFILKHQKTESKL